MTRSTASAESEVIPAPQIDLEATLDGGQAFRWWPENGAYRGVIGSRAFRLRLIDEGLLVEPTDGAGSSGLAGAVIDYLSLAKDYGQFASRFKDDACIGPAVRGYGGLRLLRQDPWECLVAFMCSSASNIPRIKLNVGSVAALGARVGPGAGDFLFPGPETVAAAGESRLRELGLGFRGRFVARAAEKVAEGLLDLTRLRDSPYEEAKEALMALDGVGEKIADCVLAFSLDKPQAFPVDRWIRRALEEWYGMPKDLSIEKAGKWARDRFGQSGAVAQQYMFHRERLAGRARAWGGRHFDRLLPEDARRLNGATGPAT